MREIKEGVRERLKNDNTNEAGSRVRTGWVATRESIVAYGLIWTNLARSVHVTCTYDGRLDESTKYR